MDFNRGGSIWEDDKAGKLSEEQLKRLDHLIAACIKNGIYINLNLHVGRAYPDQPDPRANRTFRFGKTLDRWYEPYVAMIEDYARGLLDRRNTVDWHSLGRRSRHRRDRDQQREHAHPRDSSGLSQAPRSLEERLPGQVECLAQGRVRHDRSPAQGLGSERAAAGQGVAPGRLEDREGRSIRGRV